MLRFWILITYFFQRKMFILIYVKVHATYKLEDPDSCGGENADQIFLSTSPDRNVNRRNSKVYMGKWNPHLDGNQFSLVAGQSVKGIDIRSMQGVWELKSAHKFQVRDIDFNPNKQVRKSSSHQCR